LVFFWKNSILRTEGKKVLRKLLWNKTNACFTGLVAKEDAEIPTTVINTDCKY
jgi:hypothetical protein